MIAMEYQDIQGLVFSGYGTSMAAASYHLLRIDDPKKAKAWLKDLVGRVTRGVPPEALKAVSERGYCLNVAFSRSGLECLDLQPGELGTFERAFQEGMTSERRTRILGDIGSSAPPYWAWGGPATPRIDILLLLYAPDDAALKAVEAREVQSYTASGLSISYQPISATHLIANGDDAREHFGFADGVSQPEPTAIDSPEAWAAARHLDPQAVAAGEFILGYMNAYYCVSDVPIPMVTGSAGGTRPFGQNGTYLAVRQLRQDVYGFWNFLLARANGDRIVAEWMAAKVVGRWPSGATVRSGEMVDPGSPGEEVNAFDYTEDRNGYGVPIGSHVRRANPRGVGLADTPEESQEVANRHRIVRRGRNYGPRATDRFVDDPAERGLLFIGVNANIERQFEFVMHSWMHNPLFGGLFQETDPLIGDPSRIEVPLGTSRPTATTLTIPEVPIRRRISDVPRFVTARGGAYFFLPGLAALEYLAGR
jgi:Dyp-type peroxidase family